MLFFSSYHFSLIKSCPLRRRRLWKRLICNDPWLIEQDQQGGATDYPSANVSFNTKVRASFSPSEFSVTDIVCRTTYMLMSL